jgi:spermidine synthase
MYSELWLEEKYKNFLGIRYKIEKTLYSKVSKFQKVDIVETKEYGKMLLNDGLVMITEKDEFIYHDMISHVAMFTHPNPKNILIIGGGDGGTAREILRHHSVEKCTMVEIDEIVVEACREFIPQTSCSLDHPKMNLIIEDGVKFIKNTKEKFDLILIDSTDPIGPAKPLFNIDFYTDIFNALNDDGIVVSQGESVFYESEMQCTLLNILNRTFPKVFIYNYSNLTYPGGLWSFTLGSKKLHPINDFSSKRIENSKLEFNYYSREIHKASFVLPNFMLKKVEKFLKD